MNPPASKSAACDCGTGPQSASRWQRSGRAAHWLVPSVILVLMPKCPVCLAAYIALFTGLGISLPVAATLRSGLQWTCIAALLLAVGLTTRRIWRQRRIKTSA
ncbi:MAG TPA: hypothetical protein VF607_15950 [Verrucomicrobiae bacterium]